MTPERFQQIGELYHSVREANADQRVALLAQADPELSAIHLVRGRSDLTPTMPRFVTAFIEQQFAAR